MSDPGQKTRLNADAVRKWLEGQEAAQAVIEEERRRWLVNLGEEEALRIYLSLKEIPTNEVKGPSPVLMSMRQILARKSTKKGNP
ncbi:MAG: hypothetical protein M1330_05025 [Armatimonadetes bacterium]|nr:hypothetical protein [Armatimonadota bacterium]